MTALPKFPENTTTVIIAGFDFGTSAVKLTVVDSRGGVLASASSNYDTFSTPEGVSEQRPLDWWQAAIQVLAQTGISQKIDAMGITGQMQDLIPVAGHSAVRPALLYSDTRAGAEHEKLRSQLPQWEATTGNHQDVSNVAAKIAWLAGHEPTTLSQAEHLLLSASGYFAWRATGVAACDLLTASTTGLLDVTTRTWYLDAVSASGATLAQMPLLVGNEPGDELVGKISSDAANELGVRAGIPVVMATGDAGATTDGLVGSDPGNAYIYLGATGWLAAVTEAPPAKAHVSPIHSLVMPGWDTRLRIGAVQSAGIASDWARKKFLPELTFDQVENLISARVADPEALAVRPLVLPGITGERTPVRDPDFRGAFIGVHESTTPIDLYLGVLTGVAMGLRHAADEMGWSQEHIALVGGAAQSAAWRTILADVFNATILTTTTDTPSTHSAIRVVSSVVGEAMPLPIFSTDGASAAETRPSAAQSQYGKLTEIHRGLYGALAPSFHALARL